MPTPPVNVSEFEDLARRNMEPGAFEYYFGGAGDEATLRRNRDAFSDFALLPRVLVDVAAVDTSTAVFGSRVASPILIAPTAFHRLAHADGERATARAAAAANTIYTVSTIATTRLEDVAEAAPGGARWFQLYVYKDRGLTENLIDRAEAAGYGALVLTVDTPRLGRRERDLKSGFRLPDGVEIANLSHLKDQRDGITGWAEGSSFSLYIHQQLDSSLDWRSLEWLKSRTKLPVLVKGVLHPDDATRSLDHGADGVWVSNHGGRQLDGASSTIEALPAIVEAVAGRSSVFLDGGVRRGVDALKAVALGADAVFVGRPVLWGLAADGEPGVARVLELLRAEFELAMALCGCATVGDIAPSLLAGARSQARPGV
jgi:isopentenyl diphosphate isomerase/L-lactate dehydrogenase-like FMN-dependent dehydrogenase